MPLPAGASVGTLADGTPVWIDAQGQALNPDGTPMTGAPSATRLPPTRSGQPAQPTPAQTAPNQNVDIAPAGSAAAGGTPAPATTTAAPAAGPPSPGQQSVGGYTIPQILAPSQTEMDNANKAVSDLWAEVQDAKANIDKLNQTPGGPDPQQLNAATNRLDTLYNTYGAALGRVQTASAAQGKALTDAIHNGTIDPSAVNEATARATQATSAANLADKQGQVLVDGAESQKALVTAQAGLAAQNAQLASAQAAAVNAKTPAEKAQLEAQAAALQAQADQTNTLLPGLVQKQKDDSSLTQAQTDLTGSQSDLAKAQAASANADVGLKNAQTAQTTAQTTTLLPAQAQLAGAQATQAKAAAAASTADIQKGLLGPVYGLQEQIKAIQAIQQQVFGPGGSGDPNEANDLLSQFTTATLSGTTPYAANVAAANAGLTAFGTQASLANAAQGAMASRASSLTGAGANVFSQLGQMNANAPAGSTAMVGAFQDVLNALGQNANKYAPPPQTPTAPPLPALLQKLAPGGAPGGVGGLAPTGATAGGVPGLTGMPTGTPSVLPAAAAAAAPPMPTPGTGAPTNAPVTINIGGSSPNQAPGSNYGAGTAYTGGVAPWNAQPQPSMPAVLQQHQPATTDFVHQLWGNELGSGAVQSPYAGVGSSSTGGAAAIAPSAPTPMPVMGQAA